MAELRDERYYLRDPQLVTVGRHDRFLFWRHSSCTVLDGIDGPAMSSVLERLVVPRLGRDLLRRAPAHGPVAGDSVRSVLETLLAEGALLEAADADSLLAERDRVLTANQGYHFRPGTTHCSRLVLAMTGSVISGLMAPFVLSLAYSRFHRELDLIFTGAAHSFVQPELFEYYGVRTWSDPFERRGATTVPHITLAKSADLVVVMPATAASIARLASGACTDLLSLVIAATAAPVLVAPTMNEAMWDNAAVRRNADRLRADGIYVMEPTFFFEAAELIHRPDPMCGVLGVFWGGPGALMEVLATVLADSRTT